MDQTSGLAGIYNIQPGVCFSCQIVKLRDFVIRLIDHDKYFKNRLFCHLKLMHGDSFTLKVIQNMDIIVRKGLQKKKKPVLPANNSEACIASLHI